MKTILVPTDFSKNAQNAVSYAVALAKKENAKIILLHAYHIVIGTTNISGEFPSDIVALMRKDANKKLQALCFEIIESKKVKCEYLSKFDLALDAVLETAEKIKPDLIVMGTKGASGIKEILMGSNTASVIEKSKCPVIAIPEGASFEGIRKVIYACNYLASDIPALRKLVELAKLFNAKIEILHASDEEYLLEAEAEFMQEFKDKVKNKIKYNKISYKIAYGKSVPKILEKYIKEETPDLLAMSTHHRSMLDKIFRKSVTKKVAFHTKIPLLTFHHKTESVVFI